MKCGKSDASFSWGSDAIKFGSKVLSPFLSVLFKAALIHGHIPQLFAFCSLVPIVKNPNKSKTSSDNYRLIAISSLILKIFDHLILFLFSASFVSPHLQFGFQRNLSTTLCTWTLLESINYFTNRGSSVYLCLLDLTKAFDLVKHNILFRKLSTKVPAVFLRLIMVIYLCQVCCVNWNNCKSANFTVINGVRQGAVASPLYFNVYIDDLFMEMKKSGLGCYIGKYFYGVLGYADDCALISPSRHGLQLMVNICQKYFADHGIKISVNVILEKSKTKCLAFNAPCDPAPITVNNIVLPWVKSAVHLGHLISANEDTSADLLARRGEFISKIHELRQELGDQYPLVFLKLVQIYLTSMYGSNLWDLFSVAADKLYTSWNVHIRTTFNLPFDTHRYIVYNLSEIPHLRVSILRRFVTFYNKLKQSYIPEVINLFDLQKNDLRSVFGRNCFNIANENNIAMDLVTRPQISMPTFNLPAVDEWRIPFLNDLLTLRDNDSHDIPREDLDSIIKFISSQ